MPGFNPGSGNHRPIMLPPDRITTPSIKPDCPAEALRVVNQISAMVAYWDANQRCVFSNSAYQEWFGKSPEQMLGMTMLELLGPLYEKNLPYIQGAVKGELQVFERRIPLPGGGFRDSVATYTPDIIGGVVRGFSVHVADVTRLRQRETALAQTIRDVIQTLEKTKDSFRSKDLGKLRQQLQLVLERLAGP